MKAKYVIIGIALVSLLGACSRDEASLFDKSAAQRAQEALDNAQAILIAPANGWEMLLFANDESKGYNVLVDFDKNGKVTATAKNKETTGGKILTDSSTWVVKNDYGPILSFDTYNNVLHAWSDPKDDGEGLGGDYEFLIVEAKEDFVRLKGKKRGGYQYGEYKSCYCYLYRINESVTPAAYFADIEAMQSKLFDNGNFFTLQTSKESLALYDGGTGIFTVTAVGGDPLDENAEWCTFATNRSGIQLSNTIHENEELYFTVSGSRLVSGAATIAVPALDSYFDTYVQLLSGGWTINASDMCASVKTAWDAADEEIKVKYNNKKKGGITDMTFKKKASNGQFVMAFSYIGSGSKSNTFYYRYKMERTGGRVKLTYSEPDDENAGKIIAAMPTIETLLKSLDGDYDLACEEALNPTLGATLTDHSNAALWLKVSGSI